MTSPKPSVPENVERELSLAHYESCRCPENPGPCERHVREHIRAAVQEAIEEARRQGAQGMLMSNGNDEWHRAIREEVAVERAKVLLEIDSLTDPRLPEFLSWVADRLVEVHGESPNLDFVLALRRVGRRINDMLCERRAAEAEKGNSE